MSSKIDPDDLPEAVADVIFGGPCSYCGHEIRGWQLADDHDGLPVHRVAEYHAPLCPVLARGAYIIGLFPLEAANIARYYLQLPEDD